MLVGDRHGLDKRRRMAIQLSACWDQFVERRRGKLYRTFRAQMFESPQVT